MALAASLIPGFKYRVLKGMYEDEVVTIVDNTIIKAEDDPVNQRKIKVAGPHGEEIYILPRLLSDRPEAIAGAAPSPRPFRWRLLSLLSKTTSRPCQR